MSEPDRPVPVIEDWRTYTPLHLPRVLNAALEAFAEHGYHGTTTRDLARRSGLSVPGVYHHYPSKQDILVELMTTIIEELLVRSRMALADAAPAPRAQFDALVESMLRFHMWRSEAANVSTSELRSLEPENRRRYVALRDEQQRMLDHVVLAGVESGELETPYPSDASRAIASMCVGVASWYRLDGALPPEAMLERQLVVARSIVGVHAEGAA